jgi:D-galactarolactone cycloisomerase
MKVIEVKTHSLSSPVKEPYANSIGWVKRRSTVLVEVITDDGVTGWGEALCHGLQPPEVCASVVETALKPIILGQDPFDVEVLWEKMHHLTLSFGSKGTVPIAMSAVDVALWDCIGRALGKPVYKLLGGAYRTEVHPYATGFYRHAGLSYPEAAVAEARRHLNNGFRAMKLKIGFGIEEDTELILAVREAVGPKVTLMLDANCGYSVLSARRLMKAIEKADIYFFEEPISPEDIEGYQELKSLGQMFIATGENEYTRYGFRDWIARRAVDIIQPDLSVAGGFSECKKILALAQAFHVALLPHVWGSGVGLAAAMQFLAIVPPTPLSMKPIEPMLEFDQSAHPFRQELIFNAIQNENGIVKVPDRPGIGVEINREILEKYSTERQSAAMTK